MKHILKRILVITLITHLALVSSIFYNAAYSYAVTDQDWEDLTSDDEYVDAFRAFCKSRDLTIEGSISDAVTSFTSDTFFNIVKRIGYDPSVLGAEVKKYTPDNLGTRYLFTATGVSFYNQIFAQFLYDYDLTYGDENVDKTVYSGKWFIDADGYKCLVYYLSGWPGDASITYSGTPYKYNTDLLTSMFENNIGATFHVDNSYNQTLPILRNTNDEYGGRWVGLYLNQITNGYNMVNVNNSINEAYGYPAIYTYDDGATLIFGCLTEFVKFGGSLTSLVRTKEYYAIGSGNGSEDVDIKVVSPVISQPFPDDEPLQVLPNGDTSTDTTPDDGSGGSGSGGSGSGGSDSNNIDVSLPNINIPDLGNIDWSLSGLTDKFPFCIPFDLYHFVDILDAEPETPKFEGSINLIVTTWNLDYDLTAFDDLAAIVRNVEFIGFCIGLIFITRKIIKG